MAEHRGRALIALIPPRAGASAAEGGEGGVYCASAQALVQGSWCACAGGWPSRVSCNSAGGYGGCFGPYVVGNVEA